MPIPLCLGPFEAKVLNNSHCGVVMLILAKTSGIVHYNQLDWKSKPSISPRGTGGIFFLLCFGGCTTRVQVGSRVSGARRSFFPHINTKKATNHAFPCKNPSYHMGVARLKAPPEYRYCTTVVRYDIELEARYDTSFVKHFAQSPA